jgi:hypothetical protein
MSRSSQKRSISDDVWRKHFLDTSGSYDGDRFETLSFEILKAEFGGDWCRTKRSFDGNKDFVLEFQNRTIWAESKAYAKTLTYHVVSPTLFMALIGEPEAIVLISRSGIHVRSKCYLAQFQRKTGKRIIALDGDTLDRLIISNGAIAQRFFPNEPLQTIQGAGLRVLISRTPDVTVNPQGGSWGVRASTYLDLAPSDQTQVPTIGVGELLRVDIAIVNEGLSAARSVRASLVPPRNGKSSSFQLEWFSDQESRTAPPFDLAVGEIRHATAFFRGSSPAKNAALPLLELEAGVTRQQVAVGRASVSALYRIGLVGRMNHQIVGECREAARTRRRSWVLQIEGGSGIGKTRLLHEIAGEFATAGYEVHSVDKEFYEPQKSEEILRGLLAQINHLPLIDEGGSASPDGPGRPEDDLVLRLIFAAECPERRQPTVVADALLRSALGRKTALIVDNVQNFDDVAASTLDVLVTRLRASTAGDLVLILAFNTDLGVIGSEAEALRRRLAGIATSFTSETVVRRWELEGFSDDEADEFVYRAVAASDSARLTPSAYPRTFQAFRQFVPRNALHMWETLRWLRDKGVLRLRNEVLVIADAEDSAIAAMLANAPPDLEALMDRRWNEVQKASDLSHTRNPETPSGAEIRDAVRTACFLGPSVRRHFAVCGVARPALDRLVHLGILVDGGLGELRFVHQRIFRVFQKRFETVAPDKAADLVEALKRLRLAESRFEPFFILSAQAGASRVALLKRTCNHFLERGTSHEYFESFLSFLVGDLLADDCSLDEISLRVFMKACHAMQSMKSMRAGYDLIHRCFMEKVVIARPAKVPGRALVEFNRHHINAALAVADDETARSLVEDAIRKVERSRFDSDRDRRLALAVLLDRKASILKASGSYEESIVVGRQALDIAVRENDRWLEIELLSNTAETHFRTPQEGAIEEGQRMLSRAVKLFDDAEDRWSLADPVPVRSFVNRARLHLRNLDWRSVTHEAERGIQYADGVQNRFWAVRLALLAAAGWLLALQRGEASCDTMLRSIWRAQDIMNVHGARRDSWTVPYLSGKTAILARDWGRADDCFRQAIETLSARNSGGSLLFSRVDLAIDIAVCTREAGLAIHKELPELLNNPYVAAECHAIVQMSGPAFAAFVRAWRKTAYCAVEVEGAPPITLVAM